MQDFFYSRHICIVCLFIAFTFSNAVLGQLTNPCKVKADISPETNLVVPPGTMIKLTSKSTNATSLKWLFNGYSDMGNSTSFNYIIDPGVHTISLVAFNGTCSDTATVVYFSAGTPHDIDTFQLANYGLINTFEYGTCIDGTMDGGFILGGYGNLMNCGSTGLLVKLREKGCIDWSKSYSRPFNCDYFQFKYVHSMSDGTYLALTDNSELIKLDKDGNIKWSKWLDISKSIWKYLNLLQLTEDENGFIYGIANCIYDGWLIIKFDPQGNVVWNKYYRYGSYSSTVVETDRSNVLGIVYKNGKVYVNGMNWDYPGPNKYYSFITRLDAATGKTDWQYGYSDDAIGIDRSMMVFDYASTYDSLLLLSGRGHGQLATLVKPSGEIQKSIKALFNTSYVPKVGKAAADSNGNIFLMQWTVQSMSLQPFYFYTTNFAKFDTAMNKLGGMVFNESAKGYLLDAAINNKGEFAAIGMDMGLNSSAKIVSGDFRFLKVNSSSDFTSFYCNYGTNDYNLSTYDIKRIDFNWSTDSTLSLEMRNTNPIFSVDAYMQSRNSCPDFLDSCSYMKITGPRTLCNYKNAYTFQIHRNKKCALTPNWKLNENVSILHQTDSTITVKFPDFGTYKVFCSLNSCIPVADSLIITIKPKGQVPELGKDTTMCANTSIKLHAGTKFFSYQWQDGSKDSVLNISQPGLYWVYVIDSCGNDFRDSIKVLPYDNLGFSIGNDRVKCNNDTIHLNASPGFTNYSWGNNYKISSLTGASVIVNPLVDTAYFVKAERLPGCFAYDTVRVKVNSSRSINLGSDTSICFGDSLVLDVGNNFRNYLWSNNDNSQLITLKNKGLYSVIATDGNGCKSYDTLEVLKVFPLPIVNLDKGSMICFGNKKELDAGNFDTYLWHDGSSNRTFIVTDTGKYFVEIIDHNGCRASDTALIKKIVPLPHDFLINDTAICSYGSIELKPSANFIRYTWSTGSFNSTITLKQPGVYWLQVQDENSCIGKDSVIVKSKECLTGFYIPTAFTPNNDGMNDVFKPMIFGRISKYQFAVYNRWGQIVFQSSVLQSGWDGKFIGKVQDAGVYTWTCSYQFDNEGTKFEKGTVILMK